MMGVVSFRQSELSGVAVGFLFLFALVWDGGGVCDREDTLTLHNKTTDEKITMVNQLCLEWLAAGWPCGDQ